MSITKNANKLALIFYNFYYRKGYISEGVFAIDSRGLINQCDYDLKKAIRQVFDGKGVDFMNAFRYLLNKSLLISRNSQKSMDGSMFFIGLELSPMAIDIIENALDKDGNPDFREEYGRTFGINVENLIKIENIESVIKGELDFSILKTLF